MRFNRRFILSLTSIEEMVYLRGYTVEVEAPWGHVHNFVREGANYTSLEHRTEYGLRLRNQHRTRCDAHVWIDGEKVGVWRLRPYQSALIERPSNVQRKFTFVQENSYLAAEGEVTPGKAENGLVKVVFKPEKDHSFYCDSFLGDTFGMMEQSMESKMGRSLGVQSKPMRRASEKLTNQAATMNYGINQETASIRSTSRLSSGATILGDESAQKFRSVGALWDIDTDKIATIYLRLVAEEPGYRRVPRVLPLREVRERPVSTPIPRRIQQTYREPSTEIYEDPRSDPWTEAWAPPSRIGLRPWDRWYE